MLRAAAVGHAMAVMMMKGGLGHTCDGLCVHLALSGWETLQVI